MHFLFLLLLIPSLVFAQVDSLWSQTYGSALEEECNAMCITPDGGFLLAGITYSDAPNYYSRAWAVRTDSEGDTLWTRIYGGDTWYGFLSVKPTSDGGFILTGDQFDSDVDEESWILKLNGDGDSLWSAFYVWDLDHAPDAVETPDGGFLVTSVCFCSGEGTSPAFLIRLSASGEVIHYGFYHDNWTSRWNRSLTLASDGGCIVTGAISHGNGNFWLMKTDDNGDSVWTRSYGTQGSEWGYSVCQDFDGGYLIAGLRRIELSGDIIWVVNTNVNGDSLWSRTLGDCDWYSDVSIAPTPDGSFLITATSDSSTGHARDFLLVKISADGDSLWSRTFGANDDEYCTSIAATTDGGYVIGGYTYSFGMGGADFWLLKTTPELAVDDVILPPSSFNLSNYPNPFNANTTISFDLPRASHVTLNVFDLTGRSVTTLSDQMMPAGVHHVNFDAAALPSGIYIYRLTSGDVTQSRKLVLLK